MHIVVDATMIKPNQAGLRSVAIGLTDALAKVKGNRVTVLTLRVEKGDWGKATTLCTSLQSGNPYRRALWREARLPGLLRSIDADILLVTAPESLRRCPVPQVIIVNDLGPVMAPAFYGKGRYVKYAATLKGSCRRANGIVCISAATRLDLARWVGDHGDKVSVARVGPQLTRRVASTTQIASAQPDSSYALYVGAVLPHKNLDTLIDAYQVPSAMMPAHLVLAGPDYAGEVMRLQQKIKTTPHIQHVGFVDTDELHVLYENAAVFVLPSLWEGFGIPVIEALSFGLPVVATALPALVEAGGDAGTYVQDPLSSQQWRQAIAQAVASANPHSAARAQKQASQFSWVLMAEAVQSALLRAYKSAQ